MTAIFLTGTSTDIGKTFILSKLLSFDFIQNYNKLKPLKPLISGYLESASSDTGILLKAQQKHLSLDNINVISPWRYQTPQAPDLAQRKENKSFQYQDLLGFCQQQIQHANQQGKCLIIEGVGGVMSPISEQQMVIDWIKALKLPVILVSGTYLGSITHLLTAIASLKAYQIPIGFIILNETPNSTVSLQDTLFSVRHHTNIPIKTMRHDPQDLTCWRDLHQSVCAFANVN